MGRFERMQAVMKHGDVNGWPTLHAARCAFMLISLASVSGQSFSVRVV